MKRESSSKDDVFVDLPESPVICDPDMAPVRLDRARTTMEKTNDRIRTRVKSLRDTIDKAKFKKTDQYA